MLRPTTSRSTWVPARHTRFRWACLWAEHEPQRSTRKYMNKWILILPLCFLAVLSTLALPHSNNPMNAVPENLWTSDGQWGNPSKSTNMETFLRTEYGTPWAWLVVDKGVSVDAWYAKMDTKFIVIYLLVSALIADSIIRTIKRRTIGSRVPSTRCRVP